MTTALRPPLPYFGAKQRIAEQIVALFPEHEHYVEPYCGGMSVLLAKSPAKIETVNDLDHHLVKFWRVLRDRPDELLRACELTPHSRVELAESRTTDDCDDLEVARRVWVHLTQGRAGLRTSTGWRFYLDATATNRGMPGYLDGYRDRMPAAARRLAHVSLECRDALDVVRDYGRQPSTLLYVDPPYLPETRTGGKYRHEATAEHHRELLGVLAGCRARVALSGYASALYAERLNGWHQTLISASTQQANKVGRNGRTEVVWTNYEPHPGLFDASVPGQRAC
ncbi:DNA adenine methylase [Auraticoccus monumenti]|uniref:DNA adenine methylase n=1 Tax=Auraticoccus monumenti TaxID=675864 RepID=A0A1G6UNU3_9ACTN|nr:DNA adenine methylase [Auraticoccus monumenti]SDD43058.1 DNA adenine methylase [Auraticoccus monumenti]